VFLATGIGFAITCVFASYVTRYILKVFVLNTTAVTLRKLIVLSYVAIFLILTILDVY
jgi:hypothetical protein